MIEDGERQMTRAVRDRAGQGQAHTANDAGAPNVVEIWVAGLPSARFIFVS